MKSEPRSLTRRVAQNAPGPSKPQSRVSNRRNASRRPSYRCFLICPLIFSMKCVDPSCITFLSIRRNSQIFSLVHPRDLMRISWTSKTLNEFLTSKSSRHVWQASFKTIPEREKPPPCPSEMTEMAYANLVYGHCCMVCASVTNGMTRSPNRWLQNCGDANGIIPAWRSLVRLCGPCVEEMYVLHVSSPPFGNSIIPTRAMDLYDTRGDLDYGTDMSKILPTFRVKCTCVSPRVSLLCELIPL